MRVLFLNYEYPPLGGGAGNATFYLLKEFSKIPELEIDLVTSAPDNKFAKENLGERISLYKLPIGDKTQALHFQTSRDLLLYAWKAYFFSKKLAKRKKYNLTLAFFGIPCGYLAMKLKIPYLVSLRGSDVPGYSERFSFFYRFLCPLIKIIWRRAAGVVTNSEDLKNLALKTDPKREINVIPNGIDIQKFYPFPEKLPNKNLKIICVSRLTRRKGLNYLLEAFSQLVGKYPNLVLEIVGEGEAREELEKQARSLNLGSRINFKGLVPHGELPRVYNSADLFVLPSLNEGMSNTLLEALASGLPIIATKTGGSEELVKEGKNGFVVAMKNSGDLANKIERLIQNKELREEMGRESRKKAEAMSWEEVTKKYLVIFKKIEGNF